MGIGQSHQQVIAAHRLYHSYPRNRQTPLEPLSMSQTMSRQSIQLSKKEQEWLGRFRRSALPFEPQITSFKEHLYLVHTYIT